jgi:concanavalin A-like lectin/glucanase superfamily protein
MSFDAHRVRAARLTASIAALLAIVACAGCGSRGAVPDGGDGAREAGAFDVPALLDGSVAGYALSFDGSNDYATSGNAGFPPVNDDLTVEMWVNFESAATTQDFLVMRVDFSGGAQIGLRDGTVSVWRTFANRVLVAAPTLPAPARWHHVAYTYDRTTHALYVDGAMVASSTAASDSRTPNQVWLGTVDGSAELYKGLLDEVRIWSVARAAADVARDMLHRPPGHEPGLVAYWTFDDVQSAGHSLDMTGGGDDVTLGDGIAERMPSRVLSDAPVAP